MTHVKICGLTTVADAEQAVAAGADAIGLNFAARSVRRIDASLAAEIARAVKGRTLVVGVFVNTPLDEVRRMIRQVGLGCVQLHGDESPSEVEALLPHAYKALRVRGPGVEDEAARFPGEHILLDAYVPGEPGGTGARFDWSLAERLAHHRKVTLAGGLHADNVGRAVAQVQPFCVDVASGVESAPGRKDPRLVERFIAAAKAQSQS